MDNIPMKRCVKCNHEFPATEEYFGTWKKGKDGLFYYCKLCHRQYNREYSLKQKAESSAKPQYVTASQLAKRVGVTRHKVKDDIVSGKLRAYKGPNTKNPAGHGEYRVALEDAESYSAAMSNGHRSISTPIEHVTEQIFMGTSDECGSCHSIRGNIVPVGDHGHLCAICVAILRASKSDPTKIIKLASYLERIGMDKTSVVMV